MNCPCALEQRFCIVCISVSVQNSMKKVQASIDIKEYMQGPAGKKFKAVLIVAVSNRVHPRENAALTCISSYYLMFNFLY